MTSTEFVCDCGKTKGWITEDGYTKPCPECGRVYKGKYDPNKLTIVGVEVEVTPPYKGGYFSRILRWLKRPHLPLQWWVEDGRNWCKTTWRYVLSGEHRGQKLRLSWP